MNHQAQQRLVVPEAGIFQRFDFSNIDALAALGEQDVEDSTSGGGGGGSGAHASRGTGRAGTPTNTDSPSRGRSTPTGLVLQGGRRLERDKAGGSGRGVALVAEGGARKGSV